jgi:short-subunit dehydrogenase
VSVPGGDVLILGGRSEIGLAIARRFAQAGRDVILAARDAASLEPQRADLALRHDVTVRAVEFDALDTASFGDFANDLGTLPGVVVSVVGAMGDQAESERDPAAAARVMRANYEGPALILGLFAERMAARGGGAVVGVSSVAGDRGRASNYVYGSAKAGFTAFLSGLRNRLSDTLVRVITVKPGFVATRMTEGMNTPAPLTAQPDEVGEAVWRALDRGGDVIYVRRAWAPVMGVIRLLPERVFKRTRL